MKRLIRLFLMWLNKFFMKELTLTYLRDMWLIRYHNITSKEVAEKYPEESKTPDWFKLFPCTEEQHDKWEKQAKALFKKVYNLTDYGLGRQWGFIYLDSAPYVKKDENDGE